MKKLILPILVGVVLMTWLYRGWQAQPNLKKTQVVVIAYYTEPCEECPALEHTIRRLAWFFGREAIDFYAYNPAHQAESRKIQALLQTHGIWKEAQRFYAKGTASIFTLHNKQKYASFKGQEDVSVVENMIRGALQTK